MNLKEFFFWGSAQPRESVGIFFSWGRPRESEENFFLLLEDRESVENFFLLQGVVRESEGIFFLPAGWEPWGESEPFPEIEETFLRGGRNPKMGK